MQNRPKDDKAFDNTAFVDYEEPLSIKTEYYQLNDVLEPNESGNTVKTNVTIYFKNVAYFCKISFFSKHITIPSIKNYFYYCRII